MPNRNVDYQISLFFSAQCPKGIAKVPPPPGYLLRLGALRGNKIAFLSPKMFDKHSCPFV